MKEPQIPPILDPMQTSSSKAKLLTNKVTAKVIKVTNDYGAFELSAELENTFDSTFSLKDITVLNPVRGIEVNINVSRETPFTDVLTENKIMSVPNANNYRVSSSNSGKTLTVEVGKWNKVSTKKKPTIQGEQPQAINCPKKIFPISPHLSDSLIQEAQDNALSNTSFF